MTTMHTPVTRLAQSNPVAVNEAKTGVFRIRLDVVRVEPPAPRSAQLTGVVITLVDAVPPLTILDTSHLAAPQPRDPALPPRVILSANVVTSLTGAHAKPGRILFSEVIPRRACL